MDELLVVSHPEDLVTEFLSVLADERNRLTVLVAQTGHSLTLPPSGFARRMDAVTALLGTAGAPLSRAQVEAAAAGASAWTHSPADERQDRARLAAWVASAAGGALCSTGVSASLRFVAERAVPLRRDQIETKLALICEHADPNRPIPLAAVADCERFYSVSCRQARQLYALRHGHGPEVELDAEPWDFATSSYERDRLAATAAWARRSLDPADGPLSELGACEGALTDLLLDQGFDVAAYEPDERFLAHLRKRLDGRPGLHIGAESLEDLATDAGLTVGAGAAAGERKPGAFLLAEMIYYLADLSILDQLPADRILISVAPYALRTRVLPWLHGGAEWEAVEIVDLAPPRFELVCGGVAYQRKAGSRGILCRRG